MFKRMVPKHQLELLSIVLLSLPLPMIADLKEHAVENSVEQAFWSQCIELRESAELQINLEVAIEL